MMKTKNLKFSISKSRFNTKHLQAMTFVKQGRPMMNHLLRLVPLLGGTISPNWARICRAFLQQINLLHKHQGAPGVVKFLKVASVCTQQVVAGYIIPDLTPLGMRISRSKSGLPRIIPSLHRKKIMDGDKMVLRFWLTVFSLYRDLHFIGALKLKTITAPSTASPHSHEVGSLINSFVYLLFKESDRTFKTGGSIFQMLTSGPQASRGDDEFNTHPLSVFRSLINFLKPEYQQLNAALDKMYELTGNVRSQQLKEYLTLYFRDKLIQKYYKRKSAFLGRLAIKEEAAGKIRVFAMVDPWSQWALSPLHKKLFRVLGRLLTDGTFNQLKPLMRVPWGKVPLYSFDLSAATDRLPLWLQRDILSAAYSKEFSQSWETLMVGRDYKTPSLLELADVCPVPDNYPKSVRYSVGQPMGALSSWAMLAITHHYIVQYCAWITFTTPHNELFLEYGVLGDDIVIWNRKVARKYLKVMKDLGVEVGLAKSVVSEKGLGLEFAKRTIVGGADVSPIPFKEMSSAHRSLSTMTAFAQKYKLSTLQILRFLGYGYKVTPHKNNKIMAALDTAAVIPTTYEALLDLFSANYAYMDWKSLISYPKATVKRVMVSIITKEAGQLKSKLIKSYSELMYAMCSASADLVVAPTPENNTYRLRYDMFECTIPRYLTILQEAQAQITLNLHNCRDIIDFYKSPHWENPFSPRQALDPYPSAWTSLVNSIFSAQKELDRIQVDLVLRPGPSFPVSPDFLESQRTLRLWRSWSSILQKACPVRGSAIKKFT